MKLKSILPLHRNGNSVKQNFWCHWNKIHHQNVPKSLFGLSTTEMAHFYSGFAIEKKPSTTLRLKRNNPVKPKDSRAQLRPLWRMFFSLDHSFLFMQIYCPFSTPSLKKKLCSYDLFPLAFSQFLAKNFSFSKFLLRLRSSIGVGPNSPNFQDKDKLPQPSLAEMHKPRVTWHLWCVLSKCGYVKTDWSLQSH